MMAPLCCPEAIAMLYRGVEILMRDGASAWKLYEASSAASGAPALGGRAEQMHLCCHASAGVLLAQGSHVAMYGQDRQLQVLSYRFCRF